MTAPATPPAAETPAWTDAALGDPHRAEDKPQRVRRMFASIAHAYDLNNRVHSLWRDQAWRRRAVREAGPGAGDRVLDVACGTGDLTMAFARAGAREVVGVDYTPEMLAIAKHKLERLPAGARARTKYIQGDAMDLPFDDASFDILSIAFGIRNVQDPGRAIAEFRRVLRPAGRLVILEFDRPSFAPFRWFNDVYCGWVMPRTATLLAHDRSGAYRYLPKSVGTFMPRRELCAALERAGFVGVGSAGLTLGICRCYRAEVPAP